MNLFGWSIRRKEVQQASFAKPDNDDGAAIIDTPGPVGGAFGMYLDLSSATKAEAELISRYRTMALDPEIEPAIENITNEAIVIEEDDDIVKVSLEEAKRLPPAIVQAIEEEFDNILSLLNFGSSAYEIFKRWYIDGRLYFHAIIDPMAPQNGLLELRYIDPRKIKKIKEIKKVRAQDNPSAIVQKVVNEYYVFNDQGFNGQASPTTQPTTALEAGLKIAKDAIVYITSGLLDESGTLVLSYLNKAIRPLNMLRTLEDSAVIYRLVRAPERRIWYIDVGNLPKVKAEQYVNDMMVKYKNSVVYDSSTGKIRDDRKHMTMTQDIWLSRRDGTKGTEIDTLPGASSVDQLDEINYFLKKLYKALHVPISRLDPDMVVSLGQATEITRDEVNFAKFIDRLRMRFGSLFLDLLEKQLVLKGIMSPEDWKTIKQDIKFIYARDNLFSELKDQTLYSQRMATVQQMLPVTGRFVSNEWVRRHVMRQDDEEMAEIDEQIMEERENPIYMVPVDPEGNPMALQPGMGIAGGPPPVEDDDGGQEPDPKANKDKDNK